MNTKSNLKILDKDKINKWRRKRKYIVTEKFLLKLETKLKIKREYITREKLNIICTIWDNTIKYNKKRFLTNKNYLNKHIELSQLKNRCINIKRLITKLVFRKEKIIWDFGPTKNR